MYAEYPAIVSAYLELYQGSEQQAIKLEALKRLVFLIWYSFVTTSVESGISELSESVVRDVMQSLDRAIDHGISDDELRAMLAWYRDTFAEPFEYFGPVRSLDPFIRDVTSDDGHAILARSQFAGRGQLGTYWSAVVSA
jgi:hypothetical protein